MTGTATAAPASGAQAGPPPPPNAPFRTGTIRTLSTDGYNQTVTLATTATDLPTYEPTPNAYIRGVWILAQAVAAGNAATVVFAGDAPLNAYSSVTFQDANEKPICGPFDSYTLAVINKLGGYFNQGDPRASSQYVAVAGSGATGGSFTEILYVPLEVVSRDGLGALQNKSGSSQFQLKLTVNTLANIYSTAPTAAPTLKTTLLEDGWLQPKPTDLTGTPLSQAPPQLGTTQYHTRGTYNSLNGSQEVQLTQGLGYPIRNWYFLNYDVSNGTRATGDTDWPDPYQWIFKGTSIVTLPKIIWKDQMTKWFNLYNTTADAANGLENGVFVMPFDHDFGLAPGAELRNALLGTQQGDINQLVGSFNGNSKLYFVANYVAPAGGPTNLASIRAGA